MTRSATGTPRPQEGILPAPSEHALFLILGLRDRAAHAAAAARVAASAPAITRDVRALDPGAALVCTVGLGPELWDVLSPTKRPAGLRPFPAMEAGGRRAPGTGGDLLFHVLSRRVDLPFELARQLVAGLAGAVEVMEEVRGFQYLDSRDLTGFIDGTENPTGEARARAALIGPEDPEFAGGSYVFTQRYVHDLERWEALPESEQERVIGRRKADSEELPDDAKPPTAHISRVVIEEHGEELEILRHSFPYGTTTEAGLFFIAYCRTLDTPEKMLRRMMGSSGDGLHDHLMDYTRAVSGATFFAPSLDILEPLGDAGGRAPRGR
jgi:porphyrinogen peroxidase